MAETWQINAMAVQPGNGKSMLGILNGAGSGKVVRIYRMWMLNNYSGVAYTGVTFNYEIRAITGLSSGTNVTPVAHDTANAAFSGSVVVQTGGTVSGESATLMRLIGWSGDEPSVAGTSIDEMELLVPLNVMWDTGYGDSSVDPLTLREGEGVHIKCITNSTVGSLDFMMELTQRTS